MNRYLYFSDINQNADKHLKTSIFKKLGKDVEVDFYTSYGARRNFTKKSISDYKDIYWLNLFQKLLIKFNIYKIDKKYKGIIIGNFKNKKINYIHNNLDITNILVRKFKSNKKKVIQVFDSFTFDFKYNKNADLFFIPSKLMRDNFIPKSLHNKCIYSGIIFNPLKIKSKLNKKEFYKKYNLNYNLKLIAIYPSRYDRLKDLSCSNKYDFDFFCRLEEINKIIKKKGYQFVIKLHGYDYFKHKFNRQQMRKYNFSEKIIKNKIHPSDFYLKGIPKVSDDDFSSLIKYSSSSIIFISSLIYFQHLFKKPSIYIGKLWPKDRALKKINKSSKYLSDLIFGKALKGLSRKSNSEIISDIIGISEKLSFDYFDYKKDHPITGDLDINGLNLFYRKLKE